jgi:hypothetical protein
MGIQNLIRRQSKKKRQVIRKVTESNKRQCPESKTGDEGAHSEGSQHHQTVK